MDEAESHDIAWKKLLRQEAKEELLCYEAEPRNEEGRGVEY